MADFIEKKGTWNLANKQHLIFCHFSQEFFIHIKEQLTIIKENPILRYLRPSKFTTISQSLLSITAFYQDIP